MITGAGRIGQTARMTHDRWSRLAAGRARFAAKEVLIAFVDMLVSAMFATTSNFRDVSEPHQRPAAKNSIIWNHRLRHDLRHRTSWRF